MIEIYLDDANLDYAVAEKHFYNANVWAIEHCDSYQGHNIQDVSDVSYTNDLIACYWFKDEKEALIFRLKYETAKA